MQGHLHRRDGGDLLPGRRQPCGVARRQVQVAAFAREGLGAGQAYALGRAGDEYGLAFEFEVHRGSPFSAGRGAFRA
jgi:hypothetical protein